MDKLFTHKEDEDADDDELFAQLEAELDDNSSAAERERGMREMMEQYAL